MGKVLGPICTMGNILGPIYTMGNILGTNFTMGNVLETNFKKPMHLRSTGWQYPALRYSACPGVCSECRNMVKISTRGEEKA